MFSSSAPCLALPIGFEYLCDIGLVHNAWKLVHVWDILDKHTVLINATSSTTTNVKDIKLEQTFSFIPIERENGFPHIILQQCMNDTKDISRITFVFQALVCINHYQLMFVSCPNR